MASEVLPIERPAIGWDGQTLRKMPEQRGQQLAENGRDCDFEPDLEGFCKDWLGRVFPPKAHE